MKTVKKTLDILEVFLERGNEVSISDLVEITGQNASTVHGILQELMHSDYIRQEQKRGKYSLGLKFLSFSDTINKMLAIEDVVNPFLVEMNRKLNETINLAIRSGRFAVNIAIIHSNHILAVSNEKVGTPLYCTGVGKILLSGMSDQDLQSYFKSEKLKRYTSKTIINKSVLLNQLKLVRRKGIANDDEEYELGVRNIAAAIKDHSGQVTAAMGIIGPKLRLTNKRIAVIAPLMLQTANQISGALGYSRIQGQRTRGSRGLA